MTQQATETAVHQLAAALADNPPAVVRLLAEHSANDDGMCRTCSVGGTGLLQTPHPCGVRTVADLATAELVRREQAPRSIPEQQR